MTTSEKPKKTKGPVRFEAIIPFAIFSVGVWAYFFFLFDLNMKSAIEYIGYNVVGAEVNVSSFKSSFWNASLKISGIQITDSEQPTHNTLEVGEIRFALLWDALLRGKFVVNEAVVDHLKIGTQRKTVGKVKPPEPPSNEPSAVEKEAEKLKQMAVEKAKKEYADNLLGDIANVLSGTSGQDQLKNIEGTLKSKQMAQDFEKAFKEKQASWDQRFKTLPTKKDFDLISQRLNKVKTKDFKTPQELQASLKEVETVLKEADVKIKEVNQASTDLNLDLKKIDADIKELESQIKADIKDLEARFRIPKIDAETITRALFQHYLGPYMAKINKYRALAEKYVPPNLMKKATAKGEKSEDAEVPVQAHPRANGKVYEFGRPNSYPLFWVKRAGISSNTGADADAGNITGEILDITSNQRLTGKPTLVNLNGDFPSSGINKFASQISIDNGKADSVVNYLLTIGSYPISSRQLINSPDVQLAFANATSSLKMEGSLVALKSLKLDLENQIQNLKYDINAKNSTVKEVLQKVFAGVPTVNVSEQGQGDLPDVPIKITSNLGSELQKGFEKEIQAKIAEAQVKIKAYIDEQIGKEKAKIDAQVAAFKTQFESEIKKAEAQFNANKAEAEAKIAQAKSDAESQANKAKKQAEDEAKKKLEAEVKKALGKDGDKKLDDLKKKLKIK